MGDTYLAYAKEGISPKELDGMEWDKFFLIKDALAKRNRIMAGEETYADITDEGEEQIIRGMFKVDKKRGRI